MVRIEGRATARKRSQVVIACHHLATHTKQALSTKPNSTSPTERVATHISEVDVATSVAVEQLATILASQGLKAMDALHLASAIEGGSDYFLTTDKQILRRMAGEVRIKVLDPVDFIREVEVEE